LTAAISAHDLNILSAKIYCRATGGPNDEAVDFFLVCPVEEGGGPYHEAYVGSLRRSIVSLLRGEVDIRAVGRRAKLPARPTRPPSAEVQFDDRCSEADRLTVDTQDRPGLLLVITTALFLEEARILGAEVSTAAGQAHDEFDVVDWDGSRLTQERKAIIVESVTKALTAVS
jgi:UTP:GlnB (protein PII) uridylyltransferase